VQLDSIERELIAETDAFADFIDEHILWIRGAAPLAPADVPRASARSAGSSDRAGATW